MFVHHFAYRHENGTIEEFAGRGLTPAAARQDGVLRAKAAVALRAPARFSLNRIVGESPNDTAEQARQSRAIETRNYLGALL
jgi:hypothetical protein